MAMNTLFLFIQMRMAFLNLIALSSVFSLTVDVNSLPEGYGIDHHTSMYLPEIRSDTFALSAVNRAEVVTDNLKYPSIVLFNGDGEEVYAPYEFTPHLPNGLAK